MAVPLHALTRYLDELLQPQLFSDYAPNGLQVEGNPTVERVVTAVSANQASIAAAVAEGADAMVVHHGFFWRNEERTIVGLRARRLASLLNHGISLLAYHLPLDAHHLVGNNVGLLNSIGAVPEVAFGGTPPIGWIGGLPTPRTLTSIVEAIAMVTGRQALSFAYGPTEVTRVAAVSGGGAGYFEEAIATGADIFVTGEPAEMTQGLASELCANFVAAGHHGTERFGPRALGENLAARFGIDVKFCDVDNPV